MRIQKIMGNMSNLWAINTVNMEVCLDSQDSNNTNLILNLNLNNSNMVNKEDMVYKILMLKVDMVYKILILWVDCNKMILILWVDYSKTIHMLKEVSNNKIPMHRED